MRYYEIKHNLLEGVTAGKAELEAVLGHADDFRMGIEYEFNVNYHSQYMGDDEDDDDDLDDVDYVERVLDAHGIHQIDSILEEHDGMIEVVTDVLTIEEGLSHIKRMFYMMNALKFDTEDFAGMHISISYKDGSSDINLTKFLVLMSSGYLHRIFPERRHVEDIRGLMIQAIRDDYSESEFIVDEVEQVIENNEGVMAKEVTIKISDFFSSNGRIELRFPGGADYQRRFNEMRWHTLRALYLLGIAHSDELFQKDYIKNLYKIYHEATSEESKLFSSFTNSVIGETESMNEFIDIYFSDKKSASKSAKYLISRINEIPARSFIQFFEHTNDSEQIPPNILGFMKTNFIKSLSSLEDLLYVAKHSDDIDFEGQYDLLSEKVKQYTLDDGSTKVPPELLQYLPNETRIDHIKNENSFVGALSAMQEFKVTDENVIVDYINEHGLTEKDYSTLPRLSGFPYLLSIMRRAIQSKNIDPTILNKIANSTMSSFAYVDVIYDMKDELEIENEKKLISSYLTYSLDKPIDDPDAFYEKHKEELRDISNSDDIGFAIAANSLKKLMDVLDEDIKNKFILRIRNP